MTSRRKATSPSSRIGDVTTGSADSFDVVVASFANDGRVICGGRKGFGSSALKVDGKIFAMISSNGDFVVKLPAYRVDELVRDGTAQHFEAGRGKKMKEWLALSGNRELWINLAKEAHMFVGCQADHHFIS